MNTKQLHRTKKLILGVSLIVSFSANAQAPDFDWVKISSGVTNPNVYTGMNTHSTVVDKNNNFVYCLGGYDNSINFGAGELEATFTGNAPNLYLVKYDLTGNLIWAKTFWTNDYNSPGGMAIDNDGNLFISGYTTADTVHFGNQTLLNGDPGNVAHYISYIAKLDGNGNTIWLKGSSDDGGGVRCTSLASDASGNVFATGIVDDPTGTFCGNSLALGFFVIKLNGSGTVQWFKQSGTVENYVMGYTIATDSNGDCIVGGGHAQEFLLGSTTVAFNVGSTYLDRFLTKLDGDNGNFLWSKADGIWQGPDNNYNLETDAQNNIYVSGLENIAPNEQFSETYDYQFLEKRNSSGVIQWHKTYRSMSPTAIATLLTDHATSPSGESYALFIVNDSTNIGGTIFTSSEEYLNSGMIPVVAHYTTDGNIIWAKGTSDNTWFSLGLGHAITLDQAGNCYFTGSLGGSLNFDQFVITPPETYNKEFFLAKLGTNTLLVDEKNPVKALTVYPNPADKFIEISCEGKLLAAEIQNLRGEKIYFGTSKTIDVSALNPGVYFISVTNSTGNVTTKLIVE